MTAAEEQIDRIVREVLRRLQSGPTAAGGTSTLEKQSIGNELHLSLPVISVARLEGKLAGVKRVVISPKAVITPAAKDLLREQKIELARGEVSNQQASNNQLTLAIGVAETPYEASALSRELKTENQPIEELARTGLASVTEELSEQVARGGRLGLLLTSNVAAAACLANRTRSVRAAEARCATSTKEAVKGLGVNLLVVNPVGKSTFELKRMIQVFLAGAGQCPAEWRGKLDTK